MPFGSAPYLYERIPAWGGGAEGCEMGVLSGVAVTDDDRVFVVDREPRPAIVEFDREGRHIASWGQDVFTSPHDICVHPDGRIYVPDCDDHTVRICSPEGEVLQTIGTPGAPGSSGQPFNRPTGVSLAVSGQLYVSDGYGQHRVHRFSADGEWLQSWGQQGAEPGEFTLPHNIAVSRTGTVVVADREPNNRVQLFDLEGNFTSQWPGRLFPCGLAIDGDDTVFVAEGFGVSIFNMDGDLLSMVPLRGGPEDQPHGSHAVAVDNRGDLYVNEVGAPNLMHKFRRVKS
jgi:DNA-binding beta-propeller fold protein YncE